jgi:hypothetical protein
MIARTFRMLRHSGGMKKLTNVILPPNVTKGMEMLRAVKTVININGTPTAEFWKKWDKTKAK